MTDTKAPINCPKCANAMRQLDVDGCEIDRCEKCFGIWLDAGERVKLIGRSRFVDVLDVGSARIGGEMDAITEIDCPRCKVRMEHRNDPAQKHVGFEHCTDCGGSFFDAGELHDLKEMDIGERLRAFFGRG